MADGKPDDDDDESEVDCHHRKRETQPILRARNSAMRREVKLPEARRDVFGLDQIDVVRALIDAGLEIDGIAVARPVIATPVLGDEIVAVAVKPADRPGIGVRVEPDDVASHPASPNVLVHYSFSRPQAVVTKPPLSA